MTTKRKFLAAVMATAASAGCGAALGQAPRPEAPPTNTDEAKVRNYTLPDLLTLEDGRPVRDAQTWARERRPQVMRLLAQHQEGVTPDGWFRPQYRIFDNGVPALSGAARRTQVRIRFSDAPESPTIRVLLHVPANARGPVPTLLHLGFSPAVLMLPEETGIDEGMAWNGAAKTRVPDREARLVGAFDMKSFIDRGYGVAYVYYGDIEPDFNGGAAHGVRTLFGPQTEPREPSEWGSIGAWSWGLSRVLDWLQTVPSVAGDQVALSGVSRLGKTVLWASAQDERFAVTIPLLSGEGGAAISRRNYGETIADLTNPARYPYWYAPRYADYAFNVDALPVDGHFLVAAIAPRPILLVTGSTDTWSDPKGEWVSAQAAQKVYALFGLSGVGSGDFPSAETRIFGDMGWYMHEGEHTTYPRDFAVMADFMDRHFRRG